MPVDTPSPNTSCDEPSQNMLSDKNSAKIVTAGCCDGSGCFLDELMAMAMGLGKELSSGHWLCTCILLSLCLPVALAVTLACVVALSLAFASDRDDPRQAKPSAS